MTVTMPVQVSENGYLHDDAVVACGEWSAYHMTLTREKIEAMWEMLHRHKTLFSDLTMWDKANFLRVLLSPDSVWLEVRKHGCIVGIVWFGDLHQVVDCSGHMVFFDWQPAEKLGLCKAIVRWMFDSFPINRITVTPPVIYRRTVRLLERIGLRREGCKREAVLMDGKWNDMFVYGITRREAERL
jgi:hypothetical protein